VSLFSKSPTDNAKVDEAPLKSAPEAEAMMPDVTSTLLRDGDIAVEREAEAPLNDANKDDVLMTGGADEQPAVNDWMVNP
jgi:hypothetical protein